ncbi:MAG: hypothetical protein AAFP96_06210, partial [Bacteroidota bacterium]
MLKLEKIVLLRREDGAQLGISTNAGGSGSLMFPKYNSELSLTVEEDRNALIFDVGTQAVGTVDVIGFPQTTHETTSFDKYLSGKVIDAADFPAGYEQDLLSAVYFDYSYDLAQQSPNSDANTKGRLTLEKIRIRGQGNEAILPGYEFSYYNLGNFSKQWVDDWGTYVSFGCRSSEPRLQDLWAKGKAHNWSLKSIVSPEGGEVEFEYESDTYSREAVFGDNQGQVKIPVEVFSQGYGNGSVE